MYQYNQTPNLIQAFKQAPWRVQLQKIGLAIMALVCFALIGGIYLSISANTYAAFLQNQQLEMDREELLRQNADLKTQRALISISTLMKKRAEEIGFETSNPFEYIYLPVPGYGGRILEVSSPLPTNIEKPRSLIKPEYQVSLWEWLFQAALAMSKNPGGQAK